MLQEVFLIGGVIGVMILFALLIAVFLGAAVQAAYIIIDWMREP